MARGAARLDLRSGWPRVRVPATLVPVDAPGGQPRPVSRLRVRRIAVWASAVLAAAVFYLDRQVVNGFANGRCFHRVRVYAAPRVIPLGTQVDRAGVEDDLAALAYRRVSYAPKEPGTFRRGSDRLEIVLHASLEPGSLTERPPELVVLELDDGRVRSIIDPKTGRHADPLELERPLLEGVPDEHWTARAPLRLRDLPPRAADAVLAAEDERFLGHHGLDLESLARALEVNWRAGEVRQGGSTITQQLVKNHFLTQERSFVRKLREIPLTLALEAHFSKEEILECYLATVYLGHDRLVGVYGLAEGARAYFGKPVSHLTLGEAATLAGMIRAPNALSPLRHPARAERRRNQVLQELEDLGWISSGDAAAARAERLPRPRRRPQPPEAWFMRQVRRELESRSLPLPSLATGSAVFTTLDLRLQGIVEDAVRDAAARLEPGRALGAACSSRWSRSTRATEPFAPWSAVATTSAASSTGRPRCDVPIGSL